LYEAIAWGEVFVDQKMFVLLALKQLNVSEYYRYDYGLAVGASALGAVCDSLGWFEVARRYHEHAVQVATEVKEPMGIATTHFQRSNHNFFVCAWDEALKDSTQALENYEQVGYLRGQGLALYIRGMTAHYRGEFLRMMATGHELITLGLTQDDSQVWSWGLFVEAMARARLGVIEEALIQLEQAIEVAESIPDNFTLAIARSELARCYAQQGELLPALMEMQKVNDLIKGHALLSTALTPIRNNYAAICLALAEKEGAGRGSEAMRRAQQACAAAVKQRGAFAAGKVEAFRLRGLYDWLNGNRSSAQRWWRESLKWSEMYAMPYEKGLTMLEMGKRLKDIEMMRAAKWLFESLDAEGDFERVKQAME
jgi:tetratricopeptide (TPR) repeat protein